jgi:hypothetical protein
MGARASRPAAKLSSEEDRILFQGQLANKAARNYKAGWWATANQSKKANKNAARAKLSQLQLREKQRELKDKLAEAKVDLDNAKSDFQEAKKAAAKAGAGQNNRNARNDAEDEVDELEDKIHDIEKELRSIRKSIIYKAKTYKAFKPVKVAAGAAAKTAFVSLPKTIAAGAGLLARGAFKAAVATYNAGSAAVRAARKGVLATHYRAVIAMLEHDLAAGRNTATGKNLSNNNKSTKRNELNAAKTALERIMNGDAITATQEDAGEPPLYAARNRNNGVKAGNRLRTAANPGRAHTVITNNTANTNFNWGLPEGFNKNANFRKGFKSNLNALDSGAPAVEKAAAAVAAAAANPANAAASVKALSALSAAETVVKKNPEVAAAVAVQANAAANALKKQEANFMLGKQDNIFKGLTVKNRYQPPNFKPSANTLKKSETNFFMGKGGKGRRGTRRR